MIVAVNESGTMASRQCSLASQSPSRASRTAWRFHAYRAWLQPTTDHVRRGRRWAESHLRQRASGRPGWRETHPARVSRAGQSQRASAPSRTRIALPPPRSIPGFPTGPGCWQAPRSTTSIAHGPHRRWPACRREPHSVQYRLATAGGRRVPTRAATQIRARAADARQDPDSQQKK